MTILSLSGVAVAAPLLLLIDEPWSFALAVLGAGAPLIGLSVLVRQLGRAAGELRASVGDGATARKDGSARQLLADIRYVAARHHALGHRLNHRHPVTGLPTREPFLDALAAPDLSGAEGVLGVMRVVDYDRLAAFDQAEADGMLATLAVRMRGALRAGRPLAQVDRDCFAIWFAGAEGRELAGGEMQAIAYVLAQDVGREGFKLTPSVEMGAALCPDDARDPTTLLTRALAASQKGASAAGQKLRFFSADSSAAARARFSLEQSLRKAVQRDELLLHFQPVVDLVAGRLIGAEALLRWRHPERGLVPPDAFIPVLEEAGMMDEVGLWVLNTACREAKAWTEHGLSGLKMAVNLSAGQFHDPVLSQTIARTLELHRLEPQALEVELTETTAMEDAERTRQTLTRLRDLGVSVAIDDFGAGYSNLSYLKNLPFSKLKIDREFVTDVHLRRDSHAICSALVALAKGLDMTVLAEGVEQREEVEALTLIGCGMFQGYFFAKPMPAEQFIECVSDPDWLGLIASPARRRGAALQQRINQ